MACNNEQSHYVTVQPQPQIVVLTDPFKQLHNEWSVGVCSCCEDMGQCCYASVCWYCFLGSLAGKINESPMSCCCAANVLGVYRMKIRSILKIRGDACNDYCVVCCLPCCAGLQMHNELKNRGLV